MEKWYSRFRRGDVWFIHLSSEFGDGRTTSSVQKKSRPYLIVSCEENNMNAVTLNAVPICTRDNDHLPMHVFYVYQDGTANGKNQTILCEQITTLSTFDFNDKGSYFMYSLNLELMNQVDEVLTRQLGLKPRVADMKVIERLINECAAKKEAELKAKKDREVNARVETIVADLAKRFGIDIKAEACQNNTQYRDNELTFADKSTVNEMRARAKERIKDANTVKTESIEAESVKTESIKTAKTPKKSNYVRKTNRNSWTTEKRKQFIEDYSKLSITEMAEKWNIKKSSVQQTVYACKKALKNESE